MGIMGVENAFKKAVLEQNSTLRTDESFKNKYNEDHHTGATRQCRKILLYAGMIILCNVFF